MSFEALPLPEQKCVIEYDEIEAVTSDDDDMDEGIECGYSESTENTLDFVSDISLSSDSGFSETLNNNSSFECILEVTEAPPKNTPKAGALRCSCSNQEHDGFEDYVTEIYLHRLRLEEKYHVPFCLAEQQEISTDIRRSMIQWLTSVHNSLNLCQDSLYLAVNIIDRVLNIMQVSRDCLELLGVTCLLIACKQNEIFPPEIHELLEKCDDTFTRDQVIQLEMLVLMATGFDLLAPTVQQFLEYFASFCLAIYTGDEMNTYRLKMARAFGRCILELTLQEYEFSQFRPSLLALCVWKALVKHLKAYDGNFIPPGMTIVKRNYDICFAKVYLFVDSFLETSPDLTSLFQKYASLYDQK